MLTTPDDAGAPLEARDVELVVVAYRSRAQVEGMLAGLPAGLPVVAVDNSDGSDGLRAVVEARPRGRYLSGGGVGFARAASRGALTSTAEHVVFVNPDVRPSPAHLVALLDDLDADPRLAASGASIVEADGRPQLGVAGWEPSPARVLVHALGLHKLAPRAGVYAHPRAGEELAVDWVSGGCMAVRRSAFADLGGFDGAYYVYNEDMAFGRACREAGLAERLRTDVLVPGDSGGSGAPSLEMMRLRGASMAKYLHRHHGAAAATAMSLVTAAGYGVRTAEQRLRGDRQRAREHAAYALGALTGRAAVGGRVVTHLRESAPAASPGRSSSPPGTGRGGG